LMDEKMRLKRALMNPAIGQQTSSAADAAV
jgi:hypothetical protein